jgi:transketolase
MEELMDTYATPESRLPEHPSYQCVPGVEASTGSLGHGLGIGLGIALGLKLRKSTARVFVLLSDGECNEGSVWEAAMTASAWETNPLCAIVDFNGWQATGRSREILSLEPLEDKWRACGWETRRINGHDIDSLRHALSGFSKIASEGQPLAIIADTVKGRGSLSWRMTTIGIIEFPQPKRSYKENMNLVCRWRHEKRVRQDD